MDAYEIRRLLPHRYPFLMVDHVLEIQVGQRCVGEKHITLNEPCYYHVVDAGPGNELRYPVSLQLESFAQVGALLVLAGRERIDVEDEFVMLAGSVRGMKIHRDVAPGDLLRHHVHIIKELSDTVVIGGEIRALCPGLDASVAVAQIDSVVIAVRPRRTLFPAIETLQ